MVEPLTGPRPATDDVVEPVLRHARVPCEGFTLLARERNIGLHRLTVRPPLLHRCCNAHRHLPWRGSAWPIGTRKTLLYRKPAKILVSGAATTERHRRTAPHGEPGV